MKANELVKLYDALTIKEKERSVRTLDVRLKTESEQCLALCLVGKILTNKLVNKEVQIHSLPLLCLIKDIGSFLGSMIGEVSDVDTSLTSDGSDSFLHVRVKVPVNETLRRSIKVDLIGNRKVTTMLLRYERLIGYCLKCGCLGHILNAYSDKENRMDMSSDASGKLSVWLRATDSNKRWTEDEVSSKSRKDYDQVGDKLLEKLLVEQFKVPQDSLVKKDDDEVDNQDFSRKMDSSDAPNKDSYLERVVLGSTGDNEVTREKVSTVATEEEISVDQSLLACRER
ncbi:hypothetical protein Ddye_009116 [Dipteronia dyeriana]|uniref:Zinc knuckle CX2CX4HX4C domain-containing protein n=1 Tax=Dipteronia dyeriana TaxID=168575 RepID=A0AAE0CM26_9ROSI|nr:hypothetical protein Ddye_009116 [Dipteronia dyeriana]